MNSSNKIFKDNFINSYLEKYTSEAISDFERKWATIQKWRESCIRGNLQSTKETQIQGKYLTQVFEYILGYDSTIEGEEFNQKPEYNSVLDASEADCGLGFFTSKTNDIRVVVELKDAKKDLDKKQHRSSHLTPVEQAFSYANKNGSKCGWVIVSNFIETRLYKSTSSLEYEVFEIMKMNNKEEFLRFYFFLSKENLICKDDKSLIDRLYIENEAIGASISNNFYKTYKRIRTNLYVSLKETNSDKDELLLFTKSQKLMDRFTFICFCENCGLLPPHVYNQLVESSHNSFSFSDTKLWDELRGLFKAIDKGNPPMNINRYNGGLFRDDADLDTLFIKNDVLESFQELSKYNFSSDLNVNILGQIFEQSISDVEQIKQEINGLLPDKKGKQKDDGIFYTPYYVTRYIVEQTVGRYLNDKKEEIKHTIFKQSTFKAEVRKESTGRKNVYEIKHWAEIPEEQLDMSEDDKMYREAVKQLHAMYWTEYENVLRNIKICDPACGSGAFLNQCFDYLHEEMDYVIDMKRSLNEGQISLFDIDKEILQNNLYGVDINAESVEITKLSLWLKTAKKNRTLATLDDNIKCGNSIIGDSTVAGEFAFYWRNEFKKVFDNGGFDIIIGNPPYGATLSQGEKDYLIDKYVTTEYNFDTYKTFFELGLKVLKPMGYLGYITPNTYFTLEKGANKLRKFLFDNHTLLNIVEVFNVFPTAVVEPVITIFQKKYPVNEQFDAICIPRKTKLSSTFLNEGKIEHFTQTDLKEKKNYIFNYRNTKEEKAIKDRINKNTLLSTMFDVMTGAKPYQVGKGVPPQTKEVLKEKPFTGYDKKDDYWVPYMRGKTIEKYTNTWKGEYIKYGEWLAEPRSAEVFRGKKIFIRQTGDTLIATYDEGNISNNTLHSIYPLKTNKEVNLFYLLGILNSKMMNWYYQNENYLEVGKPMAEVKGVYIRKLPIAYSVKYKDSVEAIVKKLLSVSQQKYESKQKLIRYIISIWNPKAISEKIDCYYLLNFKEFLAELRKQKVKLNASQQIDLLPLFEKRKNELSSISKQISALEKQLDDLVYKIYDLTPEEVALINRTSEEI